MTAEELYDELVTHMNGPSGLFERVLKEKFPKMHPTLQQIFVNKVVMPTLEMLAANKYTDERNRAAHQFAVDAMAHKRHLPVI